MQNHPLTPMHDADLRRVLAAQSRQPISHVPATTVMAGAPAIAAALPQTGHAIVDAIRDTDLWAIGQAAASETLLCGGSGIALGLPANFGHEAVAPDWTAIKGPGVVLSGSCSTATQAQVSAYSAHAPHMEIRASDVVNGAITAGAISDWVLSQSVPPLVFSSADAETVHRAQAEFGIELVAEKIETLFAEIAHTLAEIGVRRIVVAGGETSGAVVSGLQANVLRIGPRLAPGVPVTTLERDEPIALALKSGNFGGSEFFADALAFMEGSR